MLNLRHTHLENDHAVAVQRTAINSRMLCMDLEKGGVDTSSASSQEAKLTRQTLPLPDDSNKGIQPVRLPASTMTASDAIDGNNMYSMAFLAGGAYGMDINYDVEYLDEAHEEEGGLRSIIINLGVTLTRPKGKVVDKDLLMVECMSIMEGYLGLYIVRDRPNKTFLMHQNAYVAKVQQRSFKGAPPKKQPITPLSYTSFVMEDAELLADRTMTDRFAAGAHLRTDAHSHELFRTLSYWAASADMGLLFKGGPKS
ncbi:unnamed protein product [Closterium sp. NIES-64]|nr:unnamed protein product [Closterium sp. NIES-64]